MEDMAFNWDIESISLLIIQVPGVDDPLKSAANTRDYLCALNWWDLNTWPNNETKYVS